MNFATACVSWLPVITITTATKFCIQMAIHYDDKYSIMNKDLDFFFLSMLSWVFRVEHGIVAVHGRRWMLGCGASGYRQS